MKLSKRYWIAVSFAAILIIANCIIDESTTPRMAIGDFIYFSVYFTLGYVAKNLQIDIK